MGPEPLAQSGTAELLIRGSAVGAFCLLSIGVGIGGRTPARLTGALFCLAAAAHTLTQSRAALASLAPVAAPVWALSVMGAGLFWAFAMELFGDSRRLAPGRFWPAATLLATGLAATLAPPPAARWLWLTQNLIGAALLVHVLAVVWTGWRGDLVEARRRLRGPLLAAAALYALVVVGVQSFELFSRPADQLSLAAALSLLALAMAGGAVFLRADPRLFGPSAAPDASRRVEAQDLPLLARLRDTLDGQELWREEGLTISALAARLGTPEHRLRSLINEGLGYRNFAAFINERRVAAARQALADPQQARASIAVIAYEAGFGSLGPFNRAFKEATGQTPTDWRRAVQAGWSKPDIG